MNDPVHRLEKDQAIVHDLCASIAHDLYRANSAYVEALSQAAGKQLLLAAYQLCTQKYPRAFLSLSVEGRSRLQADLRRLRSGLTAALLNSLADDDPDQADDDARFEAKPDIKPEAKPEASQASEQPADGMLDQAENTHNTQDPNTQARPTSGPVSDPQPVPTPEDSVETEETGDDRPVSPSSEPSSPLNVGREIWKIRAIAEIRDSIAQARAGMNRDGMNAVGLPTESNQPNRPSHPDSSPAESSQNDASQVDASSETEPDPDRPPDRTTPALPDGLASVASDPTGVLDWQLACQKRWELTLQAFSQQANHRLQKAGILPKKLSSLIFDMAKQAEFSPEAKGLGPGLLELALESAEQANSSESGSGSGFGSNSGSSRLAAIQLRLAEIHLAEPSLAPEREALRILVDRLEKLNDRLESLEAKLAIARAEAAWRSTWFEE